MVVTFLPSIAFTKKKHKIVMLLREELGINKYCAIANTLHYSFYKLNEPEVHITLNVNQSNLKDANYQQNILQNIKSIQMNRLY